MTVLETERLYLRHFSGDDAEFIVDLLSQPSFLQYIGDRGVRSADDARRYIARGPLQSYTRYGFGLYAVELKDRRVTAGMCGLMKKPWLAHADLAYAFLPRFWSQGYAREAAAAVLDEGRDVWRLDRVLAVVTPDNAPSIRLLEKLGFAFEQTIAAPDDGAGLSMLTTSLASEGRPHVALLDADEVPEIVSVLADAFHDYPVMQYVLGDSADYTARLQRLIHMFVSARSLREEPMIGIYAGSELGAVATMSYPDRTAVPAGFDALRDEVWQELGVSARARYDQCVATWESLSIAAPQLHVNMIGVRPALQGKGLSRVLLDYAHALARVSPAATGVSLTTERSRNVELYRYLGYDVVGHAHITPALETWSLFRS